MIKFEKRAANLGLKTDLGQKTVICCRIDDYKNAHMKSRMEDQHLLKFSLLNIIEEYLTVFIAGDVVEITKGEYLLFISFDNETTGEQIMFLVGQNYFIKGLTAGGVKG